MRDLNYQHLRYFWAVAREGNLTRAAEQLHVTQSAVSVQLKKLEEALGQKLFRRSGRGLELTHVGRVALDYADIIYSTGDELLEVLEDETRAARRALRVGVLATLSRNFQIRFLGDLLNRDDVILSVRSGSFADLIQRLEAHRLDVVLTNFVPARGEDPSWVTHTIGEQPVSLVGKPRARWSRSLAKLLAEEPVVAPTDESGIRSGFDALAERLGVRPRIVAEVDDMAMLRLVTLHHEGISVLPPIVVQDELDAGRLVEIQRLPDLVEPFVAITAPRRLGNRVLRELLGAVEPGPGSEPS